MGPPGPMGPPGMGPPGMGPPGGMPHMGRPAAPRASGSSKIVPVVVSAGLAVGVFAGLLFGLGTGEPAYAARKITVSKTPAPTIDVFTEEYDDTEKPPAVAAGSGSDAGSAAGSGSDAGSAAGSGAGSGSAEPAVKMARLTFVVKPPGATAKITVDGKPVEGELEIDVTKGAKELELIVKAPGFRDFKKTISVTEDESIDVELVKRGGGSSSGGTSSGGGRRPGPKPDKIDI